MSTVLPSHFLVTCSDSAAFPIIAKHSNLFLACFIQLRHTKDALQAFPFVSARLYFAWEENTNFEPIKNYSIKHAVEIRYHSICRVLRSFNSFNSKHTELWRYKFSCPPAINCTRKLMNQRRVDVLLKNSFLLRSASYNEHLVKYYRNLLPSKAKNSHHTMIANSKSLIFR